MSGFRFTNTLQASAQPWFLVVALVCALAPAPGGAVELARLVDLLGIRSAEPEAQLEQGAEPTIVGRLATYRTRHEDTFASLALRFSLGYVALVAANPRVHPWVPGEGTEIVLPTAHILPDAPHEGIVINVAEMRLYFFADDGVQTYPIGIGRDGLDTPLGTTEVTRKAEKPTWYPTANTRADRPELPAVVPPGPDNPLGSRALYLGWPAYLIHGTNEPYGIGRRVSRGCIRMYDDDVKRLYPQVPVGTKVTVVNQPIKLAWARDDLYLEMHPTQRQADQIEISGAFEYELPDALFEEISAAAGPAANRIDWTAVRQAALERRGYPVRITR